MIFRPVRFLRCLLGLAFGLYAVCAFALSVPPKADGYVTDKAGLLSPGFRSSLEKTLAQYEAKTTNQVVVAIFDSLEGDSLEDFSIRLAEAWKPGRQKQDNGVILLIFSKDRKARIEVGYGLESVIPDALAGQILQNQLIPAFRLGRFEEGIRLAVQSLMQLAGGLEISGEPAVPAQRSSDGVSAAAVLTLIGVIAVIFSLIDLFRYHGYWRDHRLYQDRYGFAEWWIRFSLLLAALSVLMRLLIYLMLNSSGGYRGNRSGYGGFSGGGGRFGGGGASGSW